MPAPTPQVNPANRPPIKQTPGYTTVQVERNFQTLVKPMTEKEFEKQYRIMLRAIIANADNPQKKTELVGKANTLAENYLQGLKDADEKPSARVNFLLHRGNNLFTNALAGEDKSVLEQQHKNTLEHLIKRQYPEPITPLEFYLTTSSHIDELSKFQHQRTKLLDERDNLAQQKLTLQDQLSQDQAKLDSVDAKLATLDEKNADHADERSKLLQEKTQLEQGLEESKEQLKSVQKETTANAKNLATLERQIQRRCEAYANFEHRHFLSGAMTQEQSATATQVKNYGEDMLKAENPASLNELKPKLADINNQVTTALSQEPNFAINPIHSITPLKILPLHLAITSVESAVNFALNLKEKLHNMLEKSAQIVDKVIDGLAKAPQAFVNAMATIHKAAVTPAFMLIKAVNFIVKAVNSTLSLLNKGLKALDKAAVWLANGLEALPGPGAATWLLSKLHHGLKALTEFTDKVTGATQKFTQGVDKFQTDYFSSIDRERDAANNEIKAAAQELKSALTGPIHNHCEKVQKLIEHDRQAVKAWSQEQRERATLEGKFGFEKNALTGSHEFYIPKSFAETPGLQEKCLATLKQACDEQGVLLTISKDNDGNPCYKFSGPNAAVENVIQKVDEKIKQDGNQLIAEREQERQAQIQARQEARQRIEQDYNQQRQDNNSSSPSPGFNR